MARRAARVDANQREIVAALRKVGASVQHLHTVGGGCPDILVGLRGRNILMEIKMPTEDLNALEREWAIAWMGQTCTVRSPEEAVRTLMRLAKP